MNNQNQLRPSSAEGDVIYVIGSIGFDFVSASRQASLSSEIKEAMNDPAAFLDRLTEDPHLGEDIIWTVNVGDVPVYAIMPSGAYAANMQMRLIETMQMQLTKTAERVSIPGQIIGETTLQNGMDVPIIKPSMRGVKRWRVEALVEAVSGGNATKEERETISNFLTRVYHEMRNQGASSEERAINFCVTHAFSLNDAFKDAIDRKLELSDVTLERSAISLPHADAWDISLTFFDPTKRFESAQRLYRFTVDVSDVIPVTVGDLKTWSVY